MKITIYELLGMIKDEPDRSIYVKYFDRVNKKEDVMWACKENIIYKLNRLIIELNDEIEIIEEELTVEKTSENYEKFCSQLREDKKIGKLPYYSLERIQKAPTKDTWLDERVTLLEKIVDDYHNKINELIDEVNKLKENKYE